MEDKDNIDILLKIIICQLGFIAGILTTIVAK